MELISLKVVLKNDILLSVEFKIILILKEVKVKRANKIKDYIKVILILL